jgi:hypothetical protein
MHCKQRERWDDGGRIPTMAVGPLAGRRVGTGQRQGGVDMRRAGVPQASSLPPGGTGRRPKGVTVSAGRGRPSELAPKVRR